MLRIALVVLIVASAATSRGDALVAGEPPLTQEMVDHTADFLEWALDLQMTSAQRDEAKQILVKSWQQKDRAAIASVAQILDVRNKLLAASPEARTEAHQKVQAALLEQIKKAPKDPTSRWLLGVYDAAHTALVTGDPRLTRQTVDSLAELIGFMAGQAAKGVAIVPDRAYEDSLATALVDKWRSVPDATKQQLAQMPGYWAAIRVAWATTSEADRKKYREQWAKALTPAKSTGDKRSPQQVLMEIYSEKMRYEVVSRAISAMGCAVQGCTWKYDYRWVP